MRQIYADESGVSPNDDVVLVAGIVINADKQWRFVADYVAQLTEEYIPPAFRWKRGFHAKDMFHHTGSVFGGQYPRERAFEALKKLVFSIPKFEIPVVWGCARKIERSQINKLKSKHRSKAWHSYAFAMFVAEAECTMKAFPDESAQIFAESHQSHFKSLKQVHKILQGKFGPIEQYLPELAPEVLAHLPTRQIQDCVAEQAKDDAILLQVADACAFLLHRWASGKTDWHTQELLKEFTAHSPPILDVLKPLPEGQLFRHGTFIFRVPTCASESAVAKSPTTMDTNQEALKAVEKITGSDPVKGEDLVQSEELKQKFREAKERLESESGSAEPERE